MGVSTAPDCGFCTLGLLDTGAKNLLGTFPAPLDVLTPGGNITSHSCLIYKQLIFIHLSAAVNPVWKTFHRARV